jgi:hypothetical protein
MVVLSPLRRRCFTFRRIDANTTTSEKQSLESLEMRKARQLHVGEEATVYRKRATLLLRLVQPSM